MNGQHAVVAIRALALEDELRRSLRAARMIARHSRPTELAPYLWTAEVDWAVQRLRSACERALGTRRRHYDVAGEDFPFDAS